MLDRALSAQIAGLASGGDPDERLPGDLDAWAARAEAEVGRFTGLEAAAAVPAPERVVREEWAEVNVNMMAEMLEPVTRRLEERISTSSGPFAGPLKTAAGATIAAEVGLVVGYLSRRVLGQYELSLLGHERAPRLLIVGSNVAGSAREMGVDGESFLAWIVLHEMTHAFQFAGIPWLRPHLGELLEQYLATVEVRIQRGSAGGLPSLPDPAKLVEAFREGGLAALVQTREQRAIVDRVQATMACARRWSVVVRAGRRPSASSSACWGSTSSCASTSSGDASAPRSPDSRAWRGSTAYGKASRRCPRSPSSKRRPPGSPAWSGSERSRPERANLAAAAATGPYRGVATTEFRSPV